MRARPARDVRPKPDAPDNVRGWYGATKTKLPGVILGERIPKLAAMADQFTVIRCLQHSMKNHNSAGYYSLTGVAPPTDDQRLRDSIELFPTYGSIVDKLAPAAKGTATFVSYPHVIADGSITPGQHASFLGKAHNPLFVNQDPSKADFKLPELTLPENLSVERLENRKDILKLIDEQSELMETSLVAQGLDENYQKAVAMLTSPRFKQHSTSRRSRGRHATPTAAAPTARAACRAALRRGPREVRQRVLPRAPSAARARAGTTTASTRESVTDRLDELLPMTDQTPALLNDLRDRGLFDDVMVVWVGEFGRTPRISTNGGRDHWPQNYSAVVAGGGAKKGHVYGASDKLGAYATTGQARPEDLAATMFEALGLDPESEIRDKLNRPLPIARGKAIREVFA